MKLLSILNSIIFICFFIYANDLPQAKIVVIIPSFNNAKFYLNNLNSVFSQNYTNYQIIYIDDASTDKTRQLIENYIKKNNVSHKITFIKNSYNRKAVANIYKAVHMCNDNDLIIVLDGDDTFAHKQVLYDINKFFYTQDIWLAYANYINVPLNLAHLIPIYAKETSLDEIKNQSYRTASWKWSGLRIFYAWLFKKIKVEDLICNETSYKGKFFPAMWDGAFLFPMMEMAGTKAKFIKEILLHRTITLINDSLIHKPLQKSIAKQLANSNKYKLISKNNTTPYISGTDLIAFCTSNGNLEHFLISIIDNLKAIKQITIFYKASIKIDTNIKNKYKNILFIKESKNFGKNLFNILKFSKNNYVLFARTDSLFNKNIDINLCTEIMYKTHARCFYFKLNSTNFINDKSILNAPCELIESDIYAWKFICNKLAIINNLDFTLYKKKTILKKDKLLNLKSINQLFYQWFNQEINLNKIGLFFK